MTKANKKELEETNTKLKLENLLMIWHIRDLYDNVKADAIEENEGIKGSLYRSNIACGGYVVIEECDNINLYYLEDIYHYAKNLPHGDTYLPLKIITDRLYVSRNRILFSA